MAKNNRDINLDVKKEELEKTAERLFLTYGYDATSMSRLAKELGVAPNTLYWYYASKDELLVGVLNRRLGESIKQIPSLMGTPLKSQMSWALQEFKQSSALVSTVHAKLEQSQVIREWHDQFHRFIEAAVIHTLKAEGASDKRAGMLATVGTFLVEGLLSHPHSSKQQEDILEWFSSNARADLDSSL